MQVFSYAQFWVEGQNHRPWSARHNSFYVARNASGFVTCKHAPLAHSQFSIHQHRRVLLCRAAQSLHHSVRTDYEDCPQAKDLALSLVELRKVHTGPLLKPVKASFPSSVSAALCHLQTCKGWTQSHCLCHQWQYSTAAVPVWTLRRPLSFCSCIYFCVCIFIWTFILLLNLQPNAENSPPVLGSFPDVVTVFPDFLFPWAVYWAIIPFHPNQLTPRCAFVLCVCLTPYLHCLVCLKIPHSSDSLTAVIVLYHD